MNKEEQVVSLKLSRKLKKLGVKQKSIWYWQENQNEDKGKWEIVNMSNIYYNQKDKTCSAFTVAELGEILPEEIKLPNEDRKSKLEFSQYKNDKKWCVFYVNELTEPKVLFDADTEADARAKMLCYLLENRLIKLTN